MQFIRELISAHPVTPQFEQEDLYEFLKHVFECEQACISCADACLADEGREHLIRCIRIAQDCADICAVTRRVVSRQTAPDTKLIQSQVQTLSLACLACRDECARHAATSDHCRICAETCDRCERYGTLLLSFFPVTVGQDSR